MSPDQLAQYVGPGAGPISFFDRIKDTVDYIGFDYYTGTADDNPASALNTAAPWSIKLQPEDIYYVARYYAQRYPGLPIYIVENGMATDDAKPRPDGVTRSQYLNDTVFWLQRAKGRRYSDHWLQLLVIGRRLRMGMLPSTSRPVHRECAHRPGTEAHPDRCGPHVHRDHS
jgi:hypothetical protein